MGYMLVDDFDGTPLDRDHDPLELRVGLEGWNLYLTNKNKDLLRKAIEPFIKTAEETKSRPVPAKSATKGVGKGASTVDTFGFDTKEVRAWAIGSKVKQDNGNPVGERGRLSQGVYDAFKAAQAA